MKPLLSLVMIVKDEAESIAAVLEAAKPFVDRWTIVDTGSTDQTDFIVSEFMRDKLGGLLKRDFEGYAKSRNHALDLDSFGDMGDVAEFQIMLSGDEYLRDGQALRDFLETQRDTDVDLFRLNLILDDSKFPAPRVFRTCSEWKYQDAGLGVHEFPAHPDKDAKVGFVPGAWIEHIVSDPQARFDNVWENHIPMLREKLSEEPNNEQALLYLAQSLELLVPIMGSDGEGFFHPGERITYAMEAMSLIMRRLQIPTGTDDERNYLKMRLYDLARWTHIYTPDELVVRVAELCDDDPKRPETALLMLNVAMSRGMTPSAVYPLAWQAAKIADSANTENFQTQAPRSLSVLWKAHFVAARAALAIAKSHPEATTADATPYAKLAQTHINMGVQAGGPGDGFFDFNVIQKALNELLA